jgi:hypothetical protein
MNQAFQIVSPITRIETTAVQSKSRASRRLSKLHGQGRWRKMKGVAWIRLRDGELRRAELHWYEAHGIGRVEIKRKRYLP